MDLDLALTVATKAAHKAGERIKQGLTEPMNFTSKGDIADRVTQTDFDCQKIIREALAKEFPEIGFLGEEDESIPDTKNAATWIVDPIDGTMNFTHRMPFCGVSIGLQVEGEMVLGVIYFPALGWMYTAIKGKGALMNGKPIRVSTCAKFEDAMISELFSDRESRGKMLLHPPVMAYRRFGSAITSLGFIASGMIDGTVIRCWPWDIAAGKVIIEEAGGKVTLWKDDPENPRTVMTCIASTPKIHGELCAFVKDVETRQHA